MVAPFTATSGWSNLNQGNFVPEIFSKDILKFFRKVAVAQDITNTDYFGEIANYGDVVHIINEPTVSVATYTRYLNLETQFLADDALNLVVDQAKYFQFAVDDIEAKHSHVNWNTLATSAAAYALKDDYDTAILSHMKTNAGSAVTMGSDSATKTQDVAASSGSLDVGYGAGEISPVNFMAHASRLLDEQNAPEEGRWFVAPPGWWELTSDENAKLLDRDISHDGDSKLRNGRVTDGLIRGFRCYKTNNLPATTNSTDQVLFGHMSAVASIPFTQLLW
jgi:hypothetical protein